MATALRSLDAFRKPHDDFILQTTNGAALSICAVAFVLLLFVLEAASFMSTTLETSVVLDTMNADEMLRINFNISMLDLACHYATIDVYDLLGTNTQNVTKNVEKWHLDARGGKRGNHSALHPDAGGDIAHDTHHADIDALHANGVHAVSLDESTFEGYLKERPREFVFVDFYAPWCSWCKRLEATWEVFAEEVEKRDNAEAAAVEKEKEQEKEKNEQEGKKGLLGGVVPSRVRVAKVDCVANRQLCAAQRIVACEFTRLPCIQCCVL